MRRLVLVAAAVAALLVGLFPPYEETLVIDSATTSKRVEQPSRFYSVFEPPRSDLSSYNTLYSEHELDVELLAAEWAVLAVVSLLLFGAAGIGRNKKRNEGSRV